MRHLNKKLPPTGGLPEMKFTKLLTSAAVALGLATTAMADDKTKVGFVYVGPVGDGGWTYEHNKGRLAVEEHFGDKVETTFVESVPEGADAERVITQMALQGADLIFTTSFGYMDPTINVAKKFPKVKFEHATGYKQADNVSVYSARFYEGRAVQGHIAGKMTKTNKIGYIASFPIPEVIRGINSAYIHAKKVNPNVEFSIIWAYTWFDPAKEADAAKALIEQGADVILQHTDSTAPQAAAQAAGNVVTFGQASDMGEYAPFPRVSSIIDDWAPYYIARTQAVMDGSWESVSTWDGIGAGMVGIGEISDAVPADVKAEALALVDALADGSYHAFTGPLNKQDGTPWLAEGETAQDYGDDGLAGMNFYLEGITAEIPN
jgi:simple sugar transport system substrate-binding protein